MGEMSACSDGLIHSSCDRCLFWGCAVKLLRERTYCSTCQHEDQHAIAMRIASWLAALCSTVERYPACTAKTFCEQ